MRFPILLFGSTLRRRILTCVHRKQSLLLKTYTDITAFLPENSTTTLPRRESGSPRNDCRRYKTHRGFHDLFKRRLGGWGVNPTRKSFLFVSFARACVHARGLVVYWNSIAKVAAHRFLVSFCLGEFFPFSPFHKPPIHLQLGLSVPTQKMNLKLMQSVAS